MANDIRIGFSMHPRWVDPVGLEVFVDPLRRAGLSALEFELDDRQDHWPESLALMETAAGLGLDVAERHAATQGYPCTLVVHAAVSPPPADPQALKADTRAYLIWAAEAFPHLRLALENNHPPVGGEIKVGIQRTDVLHLAECLPRERLGICWDMGHDHLRHQSETTSPEWLGRVCHVHVHDVDQDDADHYPLVFGNVPYRPWLRSLRQAGMDGIVVLELKGERLMGWPLDRITGALAGSIEAIAREIT